MLLHSRVRKTMPGTERIHWETSGPVVLIKGQLQNPTETNLQKFRYFRDKDLSHLISKAYHPFEKQAEGKGNMQ